MSTLATIQKLIAEELNVPVNDLDSVRPLEELGIDSLSVIEAMSLPSKGLGHLNGRRSRCYCAPRYHLTFEFLRL